MLTFSTIARSFAGNTSSTLPSLPLSEPAITITLSPFFILNFGANRVFFTVLFFKLLIKPLVPEIRFSYNLSPSIPWQPAQIYVYLSVHLHCSTIRMHCHQILYMNHLYDVLLL